MALLEFESYCMLALLRPFRIITSAIYSSYHLKMAPNLSFSTFSNQAMLCVDPWEDEQ